jgi:hypothetical protein
MSILETLAETFGIVDATPESTHAPQDDDTAASVDAFASKAAPHFATLANALELVRVHAKAIDDAFAATNAAAARCRAAGRDVPDLDALHVAIPALAMLDVQPNEYGLNCARHTVAAGLAGALCKGADALATAARAGGFPSERRREELALMRTCRTVHEASAAVSAYRQEVDRTEQEARDKDPDEQARRATHAREQADAAVRISHNQYSLHPGLG